MTKRSLDESDLRGSNLEASERTSRSGDVPNQRFWVSGGAHWHALIMEGLVRVDMRFVCPEDVKKMLMKQARSAHWKKWSAKHEYEELKEGTWVEPAPGSAVEENKGGLDRQASSCRQKIGSGREPGAEKTLRHWLVGLK